jgi:manganese efflux pump family protein
MSGLEIVLIAVGLSMDAFAVSISSGITLGTINWRAALRVASFFGFFQAFMPCVGWLAGFKLSEYLRAVDHWVVFGLLVWIGGKMLYEAYTESDEKAVDAEKLIILLGLALATSIDALAVGFSLVFLQVDLIIPVLVIGLVTFVLSYLGVLLGCCLGSRVSQKIEILGGLILIGIGTKVLLEHLQVL